MFQPMKNGRKKMVLLGKTGDAPIHITKALSTVKEHGGIVNSIPRCGE